MGDYAFGVDISRFQGIVDFDRLVAAGVSFIGIRAGISWGYADAWFPRSWEEALNKKICRAAYHVVYFGENATKQMDNLFRIVAGADWAHDRLVLDLEVAGGWGKFKITDTTRQCMEIIKQRTGSYPINYSRASWVNVNLDVAQLPDCSWWLAGYRKPYLYPLYTPEAAPPPLLPAGVERWLIHQTAERGKGIGVQSHYLDYDRFNGGVADVYRYFGYADIIANQPPALTSWEVRITATSGLRIRALPSTTAERIGILPYNAIVAVCENQNGWLRLADQEGWIYSTYTKKI